MHKNTLIWHNGWFLAADVPSDWLGFLQSVCHGEHSSADVFLQ